MKLLFDQNISFRIIKKLTDQFPECKHVSDCGLQDSEDMYIWEFAKAHKYTIVTFDSDFYDISLMNAHPPKIIWIRIGNQTTDELVKLLILKKASIDRFLYDKDYKQVSCLEIE